MASGRATGGSRLWPWFCGWIVAGGGYCACAVTVTSVGWFAVSLPVIVTILLANYGRSWRAATGLFTGAGAALLYVAYLNRSGPGEVCRSAGGGFSCTKEWNPVVIIVPATALVVAGLVAFMVARRAAPRSSLR